MKNSDPDDAAWQPVRKLLRENITMPKLENPDFINARVMEAIRRDLPAEAPAKRPAFSLRWLAFSGATALVAAAALAGIFLPGLLGPRDEGQFISQVVQARAENSHLSVSSFREPGERGVVLWIDGADYIPANEQVR